MNARKDARKEKEQEAALAVQENLFPPKSADLGAVRIEGFYKSALRYGGDWWHYCELGGRVLLWIGDATGHGPAAALITSIAKSVASAVESLGDISPAQAMKMLNTSIFQSAKGKMCMTFFIAAIDKSSGRMTYCNASHEAPFLIPAEPASGPHLQKEDLRAVVGKISARLGEKLESVYEEDALQLNVGDMIYFYTDGVTEQQNADGRMFEERRLIQSLIRGAEKRAGAAGLVEEVHRGFEKFRKKSPLSDDVTHFAVEYLGGPAS